MVAFRKNKEWKGGKAPIPDKTREEIVKEVEERVKTMIKSLLETLMREERELSFGSIPPRPTGATPAISSPSPVLWRTSAFLGCGRP